MYVCGKIRDICLVFSPTAQSPAVVASSRAHLIEEAREVKMAFVSLDIDLEGPSKTNKISG